MHLRGLNVIGQGSAEGGKHEGAIRPHDMEVISDPAAEVQGIEGRGARSAAPGRERMGDIDSLKRPREQQDEAIPMLPTPAWRQIRERD
jgi:hypothetical protein